MMKPGTKDEAEGKFHEVKGTLKEKAGQPTNDRGLEAEGIVKPRPGRCQGILGQMEKALEK